MEGEGFGGINILEENFERLSHGLHWVKALSVMLSIDSSQLLELLCKPRMAINIPGISLWRKNDFIVATTKSFISRSYFLEVPHLMTKIQDFVSCSSC